MAHHSNGLKTGRFVELEVFRGLLNEKVHDEYCHGMETVGMRLPLAIQNFLVAFIGYSYQTCTSPQLNLSLKLLVACLCGQLGMLCYIGESPIGKVQSLN